MKKKIFEELSRNYRKVCKAVPKKITNDLIKNLPDNPGVYIFYEDRKVKYVGRANKLKKRIKQHLSNSPKSSNSSFRRNIQKKMGIKYTDTKDYIMQNMEFYYIIFNNNEFAYADTLLFEAFLIRQWKSRKKHELINCDYDVSEDEVNKK